MAPKKKMKLFDKMTGTLNGVQFVLHEHGILVVGTEVGKRVTKRLKAGMDVNKSIEAAVNIILSADVQTAGGEPRGRTADVPAGGEPRGRPVAEGGGGEQGGRACTNDGDDELDFLRREVFAELGDIGVAAAAMARAASASSSVEAGEEQHPRERERKAVTRFDPVIAERGGGGWSKYELSRVGSRHHRVREESFAEVLHDARQLRENMQKLSDLVSAPDRSFNAVMERVAAIVCQLATAAVSANSASRADAVDDMSSTSHGNSATAATSTLTEFAAKLTEGQLRAVKVDSSERSIEGNFWLCLVLGSAQKATEEQTYATDLFEVGWWIVQIKWSWYLE
ncbi:hypothetical protein AB1Y20_022494 [Prymnesium parvum]|uniref:Uncharacterized protein n=1 Tax=Prymnesium parvum TaxID=97485 RepID=A0AB34JGD8_PRYPA